MVKQLPKSWSGESVDVLLIQPPIRDFYLTAKRTIPYGLTSIAAGLIAAGFRVAIFDALATGKSRPLDWPPEMSYLKRYFRGPDRSPFALFFQYRHYGYGFTSIGRIARESGAFLIGISCLFTPYVNEAIRTAEVVKSHHPDCKIVLGGHHPTALPQTVMQSNAVDFVLRGEGEASMAELAFAVANHQPVDHLPGIVCRAPNGGLKINGPAFIDDARALPMPAVDLIHPTFYQRHRKGAAVITASRGCPMNCSYCSVGGGSFGRYRRRSVDSVIAEISRAMSLRSIGFIDFEDENLSLDRRWFQRLLEAIQSHFGNCSLELRAMNGLFPPSLDESLLRKMRSAGFRTINLSLGTTSRRQLRRFRRPDVRNDFERLLRICERLDLDAVGYIIVGAPFQQAGDSVADLLFLAAQRVLAGVSIFYPAPGSRDYSRCKALGVLPRHWSLMRSTALPVSHTTTREESITLLRLGRVLNFMKSLVDRGVDPASDPPEGSPAGIMLENRTQTGMHLLERFLSDGKIRGVDDGGRVFEHVIAPQLTTSFLSGLRQIALRGIRKHGNQNR